MNLKRPVGVILAGGRSSRMGVERKAMLPLGEHSLLDHVIARLKPQTESLLLSCESHTTDFAATGLTIIPDTFSRYRGPLSGLFSALSYLQQTGHRSGLLVCPCDAPFVPENLVGKMQSEAAETSEEVVVVSYDGVLQPTFSLWQNHHLEVIHTAISTRGMGGLKSVLKSLPHRIVEWPLSTPPPFFNVNTPEDLADAEKWLDQP